MIKSRLLYLGLLATLAVTPAFAQTATAPTTPMAAPAITPPPPPGSEAGTNNNDLNRNVYQQDRIENGLKSGQLSTGEAAHLEKGESRIDNAESNAMKTGDTPQEQARIQQMQNAQSNAIKRDDNNSIQGNPNSASSQRMQTDVQRDANQQTRIDNGVKNGSLTNNEAAHAEKGQAKESRAQYKAGKNGHVTAAKQAHLQRQQNHQSGKIYRAKHNGQTAPAAPATAPTN